MTTYIKQSSEDRVCPHSEYVFHKVPIEVFDHIDGLPSLENLLFRNCKACGACVIAKNPIKPTELEFKSSNMSPALMLETMFEDEARHGNISGENKAYLLQREELVQRLFAMGAEFKQRNKTIHIAVELLDRYYLGKNNSREKPSDDVLLTCFLLASKFYEIDDRLVFIKEVQSYQLQTQYKDHVPLWKEIVETERKLMSYFDWDIGFQTPYHFLEMFHAFGIVFDEDDEERDPLRIYKRSLRILNVLIQKSDCFRNKGIKNSRMAAYAVFKARMEILSTKEVPLQLQIIFRVSQSELEDMHEDHKQPFIDLTSKIQFKAKSAGKAFQKQQNDFIIKRVPQFKIPTLSSCSSIEEVKSQVSSSQRIFADRRQSNQFQKFISNVGPEQERSQVMDILRTNRQVAGAPRKILHQMIKVDQKNLQKSKTFVMRQPKSETSSTRDRDDSASHSQLSLKVDHKYQTETVKPLGPAAKAWRQFGQRKAPQVSKKIPQAFQSRSKSKTKRVFTYTRSTSNIIVTPSGSESSDNHTAPQKDCYFRQPVPHSTKNALAKVFQQLNDPSITQFFK